MACGTVSQSIDKKVHYHLISITMQLESKMFSLPTRTENFLAYLKIGESK